MNAYLSESESLVVVPAPVGERPSPNASESTGCRWPFTNTTAFAFEITFEKPIFVSESVIDCGDTAADWKSIVKLPVASGSCGSYLLPVHLKYCPTVGPLSAFISLINRVAISACNSFSLGL